MKNLFIIILSIGLLFSCKTKDSCDNTYTDCTNTKLSKDLNVFCVNNSTNEIEIINASCKSLNTIHYTLGIEGNQDAYKLSKKSISPGGHIIYNNLPFTINPNGDIVYLKYEGKIINAFHIN